MKKLLTVSKGEHFAARVLRSLAVVLIAFALGTALWVATTPVAEAQGPNAQQLLQSELPPNSSLTKVSPGQLAQAVGGAVRNSPRSIGEIVRVAAQAQKRAVQEILSAAIRALGRNPDCALVARALDAAIEADPDRASQLVELALRLAPNCRAEIDRIMRGGDQGEGNYDQGVGNQNPPPGSISGAGGSQAGRCQVCHTTGSGKRQTLTISCNAVPAHIAHGDTEGPCPVTPTQNP
jgi:hypothetical protein